MHVRSLPAIVGTLLWLSICGPLRPDARDVWTLLAFATSLAQPASSPHSNCITLNPTFTVAGSASIIIMAPSAGHLHKLVAKNAKLLK